MLRHECSRSLTRKPSRAERTKTFAIKQSQILGQLARAVAFRDERTCSERFVSNLQAAFPDCRTAKYIAAIMKRKKKDDHPFLSALKKLNLVNYFRLELQECQSLSPKDRIPFLISLAMYPCCASRRGYGDYSTDYEGCCCC